MSDDNRIPAKVAQCREHPQTEAKRIKAFPHLHAFRCGEAECDKMLGLACMSNMNGDYCRYLRHTTATHATLTGQTWVDVDMNKADVQVALGDEEVETDIV